MEFLKSDIFIIAIIFAFIVVTFLFINSKIGYVSIKKKKIRMELEHFSNIYRITSEELAKLREDEKENIHAILSQSSYQNMIIGKIAGYCYLLDYTYQCGPADVAIYDKKKNEII